MAGAHAQKTEGPFCLVLGILFRGREAQVLTTIQRDREGQALTTSCFHLRRAQIRERIGTSPLFRRTCTAGNRQDEALAFALGFPFSLLPAGAGAADTCLNLQLEPKVQLPVCENWLQMPCPAAGDGDLGLINLFIFSNSSEVAWRCSYLQSFRVHLPDWNQEQGSVRSMLLLLSEERLDDLDLPFEPPLPLGLPPLGVGSLDLLLRTPPWPAGCSWLQLLFPHLPIKNLRQTPGAAVDEELRCVLARSWAERFLR